jgi:diguanylate cyclase (GGDEF)-like protein
MLLERARRASGGFLRALMGSALVVPAVLYIAFLNGVPESFPDAWLKTVVVMSVLYFVLSIIIRSLFLGAGSYFMLGLAVATLVGMEGLSWIRMAYIPYVFIGPLVFGGWGALAFAVSVPLLEAQRLMSGPGAEQWALLFFSALAGVMGFLSLMKREHAARERPPQKGLYLRRPEASGPDDSYEYDVSPPVDMDGLMREEDESLRELLRITVFATRATGVSLFVLSDDSLRLRCSSMPQGSGGDVISPVPMWYINDAQRFRHPIVTGNLGAETTEGFINRAAPNGGDNLDWEFGEAAGHEGGGEAASVAAAPVLVGNMLLGVLAVNSSRSNAFRGNTVTVLELLSAQVGRTLSGGREKEEAERGAEAQRQVQEVNELLASSIDLDKIISQVSGVMVKLSGMDAHIYVKTSSGILLIHQSGYPEAKTSRVEFDGTVAEMAVEEGEPRYISSLKGYPKPLLPEQGNEEFGSALLLPMVCEGEVMGLVALTSAKKNKLKAETITKLDTVGKQAAISLKNSLTHKETKVKAATDALTGVNNRMSFMDFLEAEHKRFERTGMKYALVMMDVDFFKRVNDTFGHQAGDEVLKEVARLMRENFRATDSLGRYGGEEFAALLVNSDQRGAKMLAERMRRAVEARRMNTSAGVFSITMSLGIALAEQGLEPGEVIRRADEALYRAKRSGRNSTELWG